MPSSVNRSSALAGRELSRVTIDSFECVPILSFSLQSVPLPFSDMRAAVNVQHFPSYVRPFSQKHDRVDDLLSIRDAAHGGECAQKVRWTIFVQRGIDHARSDRIKANAVFRIFHCQVLRDGL